MAIKLSYLILSYVVLVAVGTIAWHASAPSSISAGIFGVKGWLSALGTVYPS